MTNIVAQAILAQLGGNRFVAMTGANSFSFGSNKLSFRIPSNISKNKIKAIIIELTPTDLYDIKFVGTKGSMSKGTFRVVTIAEHKQIYGDMLQEIFTNETGLHTHL